MRALVVSYGSIGQRHAENLREIERVEELGVLRRPTKENKTESVEEADKLFFDVDAAADWSPDLAVIASPASHHAEYALPLVVSGVDVFIEKPLADSVDRANRLVESIRERDVLASVGYNFRFHEPIVQLHRAVAEGAIGRVMSLRAEIGSYLPDWRPERDYREAVSARSELGGGALLELSHEIDLALWFGGPVEAVGAMTGQLGDLEIDVEDTAELIVQFESGAVGNVHLDMTQRPTDRGLKIVGTEGRAYWDWEAEKTGVRYPGDRDDLAFDGRSVAWNDMYVAELHQFVECVESRDVPRVSVRDGLRALEVVDAAKESSAQKRFIDV